PRRVLRRRNCACRYVFFLRVAAQPAWTSAGLSRGAPFLIRVERRLPALSSRRGANPAEPWHFVQSFDDIAKGRECARYASVEGRNAFLQLFDCAEMLGKKQVGLSNGCQT